MAVPSNPLITSACARGDQSPMSERRGGEERRRHLLRDPGEHDPAGPARDELAVPGGCRKRVKAIEPRVSSAARHPRVPK